MTRLDNPVLFLATAKVERSRDFYERVLGLAFVADEWPAFRRFLRSDRLKPELQQPK